MTHSDKMVDCRLSETSTIPRQQRSGVATSQDSDLRPDYDREVFIANPFKAVKEEDDFKDSIAFYYPSTELEDDKINLCGQISGLYKMLLAFPGAPPAFISTHSKGYATKTLGKEFVIAMHSRSMELPAYTTRLLRQLHDIIRFYHHSPEKILEGVKGNWDHLTRQLSSVMPLYMHYILLRCQSKMTSVFHCIPYLLSSPGKTESQLMLQASQLLRWCRGSPCVLSGCVTHRDRVICSHLSSTLCHYLLILVQNECELLSVLNTAGPTDVDGLPVHLFPVYLTQEELAEVTPSTRPDLCQTYRRLRRASTTHPSRQSKRGGQRSSHTNSGSRGQQGVTLKNDLSEGVMGSSLASPHPRYEVVHTTPGRGSSHPTAAQQVDTAYPRRGDESRSEQPGHTVEELERLVGEGDPPQLVTTSPSPSPSSTAIGHSHPITISPRAKSSSPSHLTVSVSPMTKSSHSASGSDAESYVTPGHTTPENPDHQDVLPCLSSSPNGLVFRTPQSSVSESRALFPEQDLSPVVGQAGSEGEQGVNDSLQQPSEHTDQHRPEDRETPQEAGLKQCSVLMLSCFDTAIILLTTDKMAECAPEVVRIWENVYQHLNALNAAVKLFQVGETSQGKSKYIDGMALSVSYCGLDARLNTIPLRTSYYHRQCIKLMHTEFGSDPSLTQGTLHEGQHCRMFGQRLGGHESYLQPSEYVSSRRNTTTKHQLSWQQHDLPELSAHQLHKGGSGGKFPPFL